MFHYYLMNLTFHYYLKFLNYHLYLKNLKYQLHLEPLVDLLPLVLLEVLLVQSHLVLPQLPEPLVVP